MFTTDSDGNQVTVSYIVEEQPVELNAEVEIVCEEVVDPTPQPTPVDPPAGGMGPSMLPAAFIPILLSIAGFGLVAGLIIIGKKKNIFNK